MRTDSGEVDSMKNDCCFSIAGEFGGSLIRMAASLTMWGVVFSTGGWVGSSAGGAFGVVSEGAVEPLRVGGMGSSMGEANGSSTAGVVGSPMTGGTRSSPVWDAGSEMSRWSGSACPSA